jgi:hypothetical protein
MDRTDDWQGQTEILGEKRAAQCPRIELGLQDNRPASNHPSYKMECPVYANNKFLGVINEKFNQIPFIYRPVDVHSAA